MLPKNNRLSRADFDLVFKRGRRVRGNFFSLVYLGSGDKKETTKIGIVVSKKAVKKATERNKLKRQIRAVLINDMVDSLPSGQKIVLMASSAPKTRNYQELKDEIIELFGKISK